MILVKIRQSYQRLIQQGNPPDLRRQIQQRILLQGQLIIQRTDQHQILAQVISNIGLEVVSITFGYQTRSFKIKELIFMETHVVIHTNHILVIRAFRLKCDTFEKSLSISVGNNAS